MSIIRLPLIIENNFNITPFEAVYCDPQTYEHIKMQTTINENSGMDDVYLVHTRNFILDEVEADVVYLQNKKIGYFARSNYTYRVDYNAKHTIFLGNHVTQKTDFLDLEVEPNAVVEARAAVEVHFKPGVHIKSGSSFHAFIDEVYCIPTSGKPSVNNELGNTTVQQDYEPELYEETVRVSLFPNPSQKSFAVSWEYASTTEKIDIHILELSGKELMQSTLSLNELMEHNLKPGYYIVRLNKNGTWISKKLYVQQ